MNRHRRSIIISGAPKSDLFFCQDEDFVIACDKGIKHALDANIVPKLLVGDFDSYQEALPDGIPVLSAPSEKDDTDTMMAVRYALEEGFEEISLHAALGGRLDHSIGNLAAAAYVAERLGSCFVYGELTTAVLLSNGSITLCMCSNTYVSVFSWTEKAYGVTYCGLKYPLCEATLTQNYALGISNEFVQDEAEISVRDGILLIILATDE